MNPVFVGGLMFGALATAGLLAIAINYWRRPARGEQDNRPPKIHEPQPVARTRLLIQERNFEF